MKSRIIVITGSIASGKSSVSSYLKDKGYTIIDADKIGHKLMWPGRVNYHGIVEEFGRHILDCDGRIDRKKLGKIVFKNHDKLKILNKLTHTNIFYKIKEEINKSDQEIIFLDIPIYYETIDLNREYFKPDQVWLVYVDKESQLERLMERNSISKEEAQSMINSQMSMDQKKSYADFIIDNSLSLENTYKQIDQKMETL